MSRIEIHYPMVEVIIRVKNPAKETKTPYDGLAGANFIPIISIAPCSALRTHCVLALYKHYIQSFTNGSKLYGTTLYTGKWFMTSWQRDYQNFWDNFWIEWVLTRLSNDWEQWGLRMPIPTSKRCGSMNKGIRKTEERHDSHFSMMNQGKRLWIKEKCKKDFQSERCKAMKYEKCKENEET